MAKLPRHSEQFFEIFAVFGDLVEGPCPCNEVTYEVCLATEADGYLLFTYTCFKDYEFSYEV